MTTTLTKPSTNTSRGPSAYSASPLDKFFRNDLMGIWNGHSLTTVPPVNVTEEKNNYIVDMAVPGFKKEDFDIALDGNLFTISCEKATETDANYTNTVSRKEYNYSSFSRTITLPEYADSKGIMAKYNDGVLMLTIPKKPDAHKTTSQKITVQ